MTIEFISLFNQIFDPETNLAQGWFEKQYCLQSSALQNSFGMTIVKSSTGEINCLKLEGKFVT